jgi:polysaccharide export outer membrane protein
MTGDEGDVYFRGDSAAAESAYRVGSGDVLEVSVFAQAGSPTRVAVRPDGRVSVPTAGEIVVTGRTVAEVESLLTERYAVYFREPRVSVNVTQFAAEMVYVTGEVTLPGAYPLTRGYTMLAAIARAGGPTLRANLGSVALLRRVSPSVARAARMDMKAFLGGDPGATDPYLQAYDIIYVPRTFLSNMQLVLDQVLTPALVGTTLYLRGWEAFHTSRVYQATRPEQTPQ